MRNLATYLQDISFFPPELRDAVNTITVIDARKPGEYYFKPGRICPYIWYLERGLIRIYEERGDNEATIYLQKDHEIVIAPDSSLDGRKPTNMFIQAMEPCIARRAAITDVDKLILRFPDFGNHYRYINANYRRQEKDRMVDLQALSHDQRFVKFLQTQPDLFGRVAPNILAEYLGMSLNTFLKLKQKYKV